MGLTPLMIATKQEHFDTIKSLAQFKSLDINHLHKVPPNHKVSVAGMLCASCLQQTGFSAAILAASNGNKEICKVLLDCGAFPEVEARD